MTAHQQAGSSATPPELPAIRRVIAQQKLAVVLQPLANLRTRSIFAYEALVRCTSPDFKSPPAMFEAAMESRCCGELGRAIRRLAIAACPNHPLFLNIHPNELDEHWLVQPDDPIFQHT